MVLMKVLASRLGRESCEIDATGAGAGCSPVFGGAEGCNFLSHSRRCRRHRLSWLAGRCGFGRSGGARAAPEREA